MFPLEEVLKGILSLLQEKYSSTIFNIWFRDLRIASMDEEKITFTVPSEFKKGILLNQYTDDIKSAIQEICGYPFSFVITVADENASDPDKDGIFPEKNSLSSVPEQNPGEMEKVFPSEEKKRNIGSDIEGPSIIREYTFDNFIVGDSNKFAHAACVAVSRNIASYNPLFIYGPSGLGKTHLLYAITNEMKKNNPTVRIVYKKGDEFTNELISSIQGGSTSSFREKYRNCDVLLIDDIQFIAGKESTQEEFFHTFSALYEAEKQIILTSDRPPKEIRTLEERLRTRFEWGLIADIQPPSFELRTAIIQKKAENMNVPLTEEQISMMAKQLNSNIRQIEGAIKKIAAFYLLNGGPITNDSVLNVIKEFSTVTVSQEEICKRILEEVSKKYGVTPEEIKSSKRSDSIATARHVAVYLIRQMTDFSFSKIGSLLNRDHTTILSSNANIEDKLKKDSTLEGELNEIMAAVRK